MNKEFRIKTDSSGIGPSDHTSFYLKNVPVLHFFTGQHSDYHKPTDDVEKINFEGEQKVLEYILRLLIQLITCLDCNFVRQEMLNKQSQVLKLH
jgi:hypothetical protein